MRRRKPDTMEIQQMKAQAKEEKQRRQQERAKLAREKALREKAEQDRYKMEKHLKHLQEEMRLANDALVSCILFEKLFQSKLPILSLSVVQKKLRNCILKKVV